MPSCELLAAMQMQGSDEFYRGEGRTRHGFESGKSYEEMNSAPKGELILEEIRAKGVICILVKPLGGIKVLLQFPSQEIKTSFVASKRDWLEKWFGVVHKWSYREANLTKRVWVYVEGVILHARNENTFTSIGERWREVVMVDKRTTDRRDLEVGRVLLSTNHSKATNTFYQLKVNKFLYSIRVSEGCFQQIYMDSESSSREEDYKGEHIQNRRKGGALELRLIKP
ncbi:hypothetical protein U1Q18_017370 [Sarracenia purpurea var. burkii]